MSEENVSGDETRGWGCVFAGRTGLATLTLALGLALPALNVYIVVTILPSAVKDIGGGAYYAWAATAFVAASLIGTVLSTKLFRKFGPPVAYSIATFVFALGTFGCGMADTMDFFLLARLLQGLGGGLLMTLSYMMIRVVYPEQLWPWILGVISSVWGIATLIGPAIGGIFAEYEIWRMAFWLVGWLALFFTFAVLFILPRQGEVAGKKEGKSRPLALTQTGVLLASVLVISVGSVMEGILPKLAGLGCGLALLVLLSVFEKKSTHRLFPEGSFSPWCRHFYLYMLMLMLACTVNGSELYLPLFLQKLHNVTPLWAGYMAALLSMGWTCGALYSAGQQKNCQPLLLTAAPCFGLAGAILLFFLLPAAPNIFPYATGKISFILWPIGFGLFLIGTSTGIAWPHLLTRVMAWAKPEEADAASTSITLVQIFSAALGSAMAGMLTNLAGLAPLAGRTANIPAARALFIGLIILLSCSIFFAWRVAHSVKSESKI